MAVPGGGAGPQPYAGNGVPRAGSSFACNGAGEYDLMLIDFQGWPMSDLLTLLDRRVDDNARAEVSAYLREFPEYRTGADRPDVHAEMMDVAVWTRRRTVECVRDDRPLNDEDLAFIAAVGEKRAKQGFSTATARQVLVLHTNL